MIILAKIHNFWYHNPMVNPESLQKYSLFGGLEPEQIGKILPLMVLETFGPDEYIITEGKPNDKIYFLIEGTVAVTKNNINLSRFGEGEEFGEIEVLDVMSSVASIKTVSNVKLMSISNKALRDIYKLDIKIFSLIIMNLARDLSRRLRKMDEKLAAVAKEPIFI
jgi:CRP/FNR family transcriptional regulator, cyclic AMP receptor protein